MTTQPRQASAVMLLRDGPSGEGLEVFMVRRAMRSDFMPGVYVFPGGTVETDDLSIEQRPEICREVMLGMVDPEGRTALGQGARVAAIRELFEEAGVLLAYQLQYPQADRERTWTPVASLEEKSTRQIPMSQVEMHQGESLLAVNEKNMARFAAYRQALNEHKGSLIELVQVEHLVLATERLHYFTHWITPQGLPKRFDTHFFMATAPTEQQAAYDQIETSEGIWISPTEALVRAERGTFPLVFATYHQLHYLATFASMSEALQTASSTYVKTHRPMLVEHDGQAYAHLPEDQKSLWAIPEYMTRMLNN
jgi:8-oxo-dGTP pyrophosphatase MutT (NUDIX family)